MRRTAFLTALALALAGSLPLLGACEGDDSLGDRMEEAAEEVEDEVDDRT